MYAYHRNGRIKFMSEAKVLSDLEETYVTIPLAEEEKLRQPYHKKIDGKKVTFEPIEKRIPITVDQIKEAETVDELKTIITKLIEHIT